MRDASFSLMAGGGEAIPQVPQVKRPGAKVRQLQHDGQSRGDRLEDVDAGNLDAGGTIESPFDRLAARGLDPQAARAIRSVAALVQKGIEGEQPDLQVRR